MFGHQLHGITWKSSSAKFSVTDMEQDDFLSLEAYKKTLTIRKKADDGMPISWLKMKQLTVTCEKVLQFKTSLCSDAEFREVTFGKKCGRPPKMPGFKKLYSAQRALKDAKIKDLMQLLEYIPAEHHAFYQSLISDNGNEQCLVILI